MYHSGRKCNVMAASERAAYKHIQKSFGPVCLLSHRRWRFNFATPVTGTCLCLSKKVRNLTLHFSVGRHFQQWRMLQCQSSVRLWTDWPTANLDMRHRERRICQPLRIPSEVKSSRSAFGRRSRFSRYSPALFIWWALLYKWRLCMPTDSVP